MTFLSSGALFLDAFSSFSNCLHIYAKDCFAGVGFFLPFLVAWKLAFSDPSFSYLQQSFVLCIVYAPPSFFQRSQCFLKQTFFGTLVIDSVPGLLVLFFALVGSFLVGWCITLFPYKYALFRLEWQKKQMHVHRSHTFLVKVEMVLPHKWAHPKNVSCQISLGE